MFDKSKNSEVGCYHGCQNTTERIISTQDIRKPKLYKWQKKDLVFFGRQSYAHEPSISQEWLENFSDMTIFNVYHLCMCCYYDQKKP